MHRLLSNQNGKTYPFHAKAQVVERDTVFVPSGWDSWGKIKVLREGFDCESISEGWDENIEALADGHKHSTGAMGIYQDAIPNQESTIQVNKQHTHTYIHIDLTGISLNISLWLQYVKMNKHFMNVISKHFKKHKNPLVSHLDQCCPLRQELIHLR